MPRRKKDLDQQIAILAEIRRLRYGNLKPGTGRPGPFRKLGGTNLMRVAKVDAEKIVAAARERKCTCAQVVNARDW